MKQTKNDAREKHNLLAKKAEKKPIEAVSYIQLFRYSTSAERFAIFIAVLSSLATALSMFWIVVVYGDLSSMFVDRTVPDRRASWSSPTVILKEFGGGKPLYHKDQGSSFYASLLRLGLLCCCLENLIRKEGPFRFNATWTEAKAALLDDILAYGYSAIAQSALTFFSALITVQLLNWAALKQIMRIRLRFLRSVLRQDATWFDTETSLNFASRMTDDLEKLKEGIAEKLGMFTYLMSTSIICCIVSLIWGWQLTLACLAVVPLSLAAAGIAATLQSKSTTKEAEACSRAGRVVEEVLGAIRTVLAFGGEKKEIDRYSKCLEPAEHHGRIRGYFTGLSTGLAMCIMFAVNAIGFAYGVRLVQWDLDKPVEERTYHPGIIMTILFNILIASQNIGMSAPHIETFSAARGAAAATFKILDREPAIDSMAEEGAKPKRLEGRIKIDDVHFCYPSRPDVRVLRGFSLDVAPGETVALVGSSGCGKSTVLQLIQRFYDPILGDVLIDGKDVKKMNLQWLRSRIGVVGQEPVLFAGTIKEIINMGKEDATEEEIILSSKQAFAHEFIMNLPDGYDTHIGEKGAQLSGGQKQRIAIARSLLRDPPLLLLDEATSALDPHSEKKVQVALEKASKGRTTIVVSHRLSTIVNASRIICMDSGKIVEEGTHEELMKKKEFYWNLVTSGTELTEPDIIETLAEDEEVQVPVTELKVRRRSTRHTRRGSEVVSWADRRNSVASVVSLGFRNYISTYTEEEDVDKDEEPEKISDWELLKLNAPDWPLMLIGSIAALIQGCSIPGFAILFALVFGLFSLGNQNDVIFEYADMYSGFLMLVAAAAGLSMFAQTAAFNTSGIRLTSRLRIQAFTSYLKQDMSYFDDQKNSVGALCARLSTDAAAVQGATGMRVGIILQGVSTLLIGVIVALCYEWRIALVGIVFLPLIIGSIWAEGAISRHSAAQEKQALERATEIGTEAISSIRTVQSLAMESQILERYSAALEEAQQATVTKTRWRGIVYGLGLAVPTISYNAAFTYGGTRVANEGVPYKTILLVVETLMNAAFILGQALVFAPNFTSAKQSAVRIISTMRRQPKVLTEDGLQDRHDWTASGKVSLSDVEFTYPSRPNHKVLNGLQLNIPAGSKVALVGSSGCGKSTCLQLLQRFYDADSGAIELDTLNIRHALTLPRLRRQLGVVSQEPVLFDRSIAENIAYGDNSRKVTTAEIVAAAKAANIHGFIVGLPRGYDTNLGTGGAQLSGGQKQRVCIARALVRSPRLLLLDEATSALDAQSQKVVSDALEKAGEGRTCVVIAHRLSTVQNADLICVIDKGKIVEKGTHAELMLQNGLYCQLQKMHDNK